jgi:5''-nucleotidase, C-terminal domain.
VSGFRVSWDSCREPGQRVLGVWLLKEAADSDPETDEDFTPKLINGEPIKRERYGRRYKIVTREYMAEGHDGFLPLKGHKCLIDDESGQMMSTIVRKYLLGKCRLLS